jgi:hypothetical protein
MEMTMKQRERAVPEITDSLIPGSIETKVGRNVNPMSCRHDRGLLLDLGQDGRIDYELVVR